MPINPFKYRDYLNRTMDIAEAWYRVSEYLVSRDPEIVGAEEQGIHVKICRELKKYGSPSDVAGCMARGLRFGRLYMLAAVVSQLALVRSDREDVGRISLYEYFEAKHEAARLMKRYKESPMLRFEEGAQELFVRIREEAADTLLRNQMREGVVRGR